MNREGGFERNIGPVKKVLVNMRTTQSYQETKMHLLQKLTGIDFLMSFFGAPSTSREWYIGLHRYSTIDDVMERLVNRQPISCFADKEEKVFHVAIFNEIWTSLKYLTLEARPSHLVTPKCGVHV